MSRIELLVSACCFFGSTCAMGIETAIAQCVAHETTCFDRADAGPSDEFGFSVAISGDRAMAGSPNGSGNAPNSGAVTSYRRNGSRWTVDTDISHPDTMFGDRFGHAVAIDGQVAVIGAPERIEGENFGSAYVYRLTDSGWQFEQRLIPPDPVGTDQFGWSVSAKGNRILVGSRWASGKFLYSGAAYIFVGADGQWGLETILRAPDGIGGDQFGYSVSLSEDLAIIGAVNDSDIAPGCGAAYVFRLLSEGWFLERKLRPSSLAQGARFGTSIQVSGDEVLVSAPNNPGKAYLFERLNGAWVEQNVFTGGPGSTGFGTAASLAGQRVLIGHVHLCPDGYCSGGAIAFARDNSDWTPVATLAPSTDPQISSAGFSLGISSNQAILGAPDGSGKVCFFSMDPLQIVRQPIDCVTLLGQTSAGFSVSAEGWSPLTFQWRRNGTPLFDGESSEGEIVAGSATSALVISPALHAAAGEYDCAITSSCGDSLLTRAALLSVVPGICPGDANHDGTVTFADITEVLTFFNLTCP